MTCDSSTHGSELRSWRRISTRPATMSLGPRSRIRRRPRFTMNSVAATSLPALGLSRVIDLGIALRAGVYTGERELMDGPLSGLTASIGARVAAKAGPCQVLVSQTVKDLVGSGLTFEDAGEHELEGVPDLWHLYRVVK